MQLIGHSWLNWRQVGSKQINSVIFLSKGLKELTFILYGHNLDLGVPWRVRLVIFWRAKDVLLIKRRFCFLGRKLLEIFLIYIVIFFRNCGLKSERKSSICSHFHVSQRLLLLRIILARHLSVVTCHARQTHLIVVYVIFSCENVKGPPFRFKS